VEDGMLKTGCVILGMALAALTAACGSAPVVLPESGSTPNEYHGTMSSGCAPTDAPSVILDLHAVASPASISFNLWPGSPVAPPTLLRFDADHPLGVGTYCSDEGACEPAEWGEVELANSEGSRAVNGKWRIGLSGGRNLRGSFEAEWLAIQALCG
jgi:hypothetical protein